MKPDSPLSVALAVPTYLREEPLVHTLKQLGTQTVQPARILVIDQSPEHEPDTEAFLEEQAGAGTIDWLRVDQPNLPAARNLALERCGTDVLVFIDDDVELPPDFIERHLANYADETVTAVAGRVTQDGVPPPAVRATTYRFDFRSLDLSTTQRLENVGTIRGCNHSVRVAAVRELGGYDPGYLGWAFREDTDLAIRIRNAGGRIVFDPDSSLHHLNTRTGGCRIQTWNPPAPAWQLSYPECRFLWKHFFPHPYFWGKLLFGNVRRYVLTRANVTRPWRLPGGYLAYLSSVVRSWKDLRDVNRS